MEPVPEEDDRAARGGVVLRRRDHGRGDRVAQAVIGVRRLVGKGDGGRSGGELGHGFLLEVAAFEESPLVVSLDDDGDDKAGDGRVVGEIATMCGVALDLAVEPLVELASDVGGVGLGETRSARAGRTAQNQ